MADCEHQAERGRFQHASDACRGQRGRCHRGPGPCLGLWLHAHPAGLRGGRLGRLDRRPGAGGRNHGRGLCLALPRCPEPAPTSPATCALLRWIRESINSLLPVAQVGGEVAGARLLTFYGVPGSVAGASVLVDLLIQTATPFVFTLVGLALLVSFGGDDAPGRAGWRWASPSWRRRSLGFFAAQRFGGVQLVENDPGALRQGPEMGRARRPLVAERPAAGDLRRPRRARGRLRAASRASGSSACWRSGSRCASWATRCPMRPRWSSRASGRRCAGAAFVVPGAIGVQEGGFVALCAVFGIPAPTAVALSLVKRLPEIVLGIPGLFLWQGLESRQLLAQRSVAEGSQARQIAGSPRVQRHGTGLRLCAPQDLFLMA